MRVLILNAYSAGNRGDRLIVDSMTDLFAARGCEVRISSDDPSDCGYYEAPVVPSPIPIGLESARSSWRETGEGVLRSTLTPKQRALLSWADICVSAGGGYLYDDGGRHSRINLVRRLAILAAARRAGRPVVLFSQSVGPFAGRTWRAMTAAELRKVDLVIARELQSYHLCLQMGLRRVELCDDAAFAVARLGRKASDQARRGLAVTVMETLPRTVRRAVHMYRTAVVDGIAQAVKARGDMPVTVVSQVDVHSADSDLSTAASVADDLRRKAVDAHFADLRQMSDNELAGFYGGFQVVLATRLHSAIAALCARTPAVAIAYLPKTTDVYSRVGLPQLVIEPRELNSTVVSQRLIEAIDALPRLVRTLEIRLPQLQRSAGRAADLTLSVPGTRQGSAQPRYG